MSENDENVAPLTNGSENNENEWEKLYDDEGKCLSSELEKLNLKLGDEEEEVKEKKNKNDDKKLPKSEGKKIDYLKFEPKSIDEDENWEKPAYGHILEIYDFPVSFKNENIISAFKDERGNQNLSLKWVDDTHCLGIFSNEAEAQKALKIQTGIIKVRPLSEASIECKRMAKRKLDFLKPFKPRPQTSSFVASRLIGQSLGISNMLSKDKLKTERDKIKQAKEKLEKEKDFKESIWNGN
ncbi:coiled-coil domain-containing R3HCC1L [Brachionus plicatilis]|uniref:Coiled-coil domain-containing R3HCC1L n=1 Tax=Brachionus plicatilis TaxID=10195 RepID=A0A3M7QYQ4_BRAPC|nr:coiled-coil domain-containing R3HCC1L [Brachionus plicatilis]